MKLIKTIMSMSPNRNGRARCSPTLLKPTRKRMDSGNTLETQLSDSSLVVFPLDPLEEEASMTMSMEEDALMIAMEAAAHADAPIVLTPTRPRHPHRRSQALTNDDFEQLLVKSRGWRFDPNEPLVRPKRGHDRERNQALSSYDFEKFIFKPTGPRLGAE